MYNKSMSFKQISVSKLTWLRVIPVCGRPQLDSQPPDGGGGGGHSPVRCRERLGGRPRLTHCLGQPNRSWQAGSRQRGYKWTGWAR